MMYVLDTSAVLAMLWREPGAERVRAVILDAVISAVSLAEVVAKLSERTSSVGTIDRALDQIAPEVLPFDKEQARLSGLMRPETRKLGLSLGDRSCLALARQIGATVMTADRTWTGVSVGVSVELIR